MNSPNGPFVLDVAFRNKTLDGDFGIGGNRQSRNRPANHRHALSRDRADPGKFVDAGGDFEPAHHQKQRMRAKDDYDRARLVLVPVFFPDDVAVVPRRNESADGIFALPLHAISAYIDPAGFRILLNVQAAGADISAAIQFMPHGGGEDVQVKVPGDNFVFHDRTIIDKFDGEIRGFGGEHLQFFADSVCEGHGVQLFFNTHREPKRSRVEHRTG